MKIKILAWISSVAFASSVLGASVDSANPVTRRTGDESVESAKRAAPSRGGVRAPEGLSSGVAEIVRLVEGGVEGAVIEAYIESSPMSFQPSADEILYLHRLGVSPEVLTTLLKHKGKTNGRPPAQGAGASASSTGSSESSEAGVAKGTDARREAPIYTYLYPPYSIPWVTLPGHLQPSSRYRYAYPLLHRYYPYPYYSLRNYGYLCPPYWF